MLKVDNTKRHTYQTCPRKYYLSHVLNLKPKQGSTALRFGASYHGMMEGFYKTIKEFGWGEREKAIESGLLRGKQIWDRESQGKTFYEDYKTFENLCLLFLDYVGHFRDDESNLEVIECESVFSLEMIPSNKEQEKLLKEINEPLFFTGRLDLKANIGYTNWLIEFKTTGYSLFQQSQRLHRNPQIIGYCYAGPRVLSFKPEGILISMAFASSRKNKDGVYGKLTTDFGRYPQVISDPDMENWKDAYINTCYRISNSIKTDFFPMELDSCYTYGQCAYTRLCEQCNGANEINTEGYMIEEWDVEKTELED